MEVKTIGVTWRLCCRFLSSLSFFRSFLTALCDFAGLSVILVVMLCFLWGPVVLL